MKKTAAYTATLEDDVLLLDPTAGTFTATLASMAAMKGRTVSVRNINTTNANAVTVAAGGTDAIDAAGTSSLNLAAGASVRLYSDGTRWFSV